ncbi:MAG: response regulator [Magnetococcales bacterium]|nr:response regulator [Magnetococcales bacterium]
MVRPLMESHTLNTLSVLLAEDNPGDANLFHDHLLEGQTGGGPTFSLTVAEDLKSVQRILGQGRFDVAVLDLNLPDSRDMETFVKVHERFPNLAIVVLTGLEDERLGVESIRRGAQDYLVKGSVDGLLLGRALRYAAERQMLMNEVERLRFIQRQKEEMGQLETYSDGPPDIGGRVFALKPVYGALVRRYVLATRERLPKPSGEVQNLALRLAAMGMGARDVVRLHLMVLKETGTWSTAAEEKAFSVDARLALVELMGNLIDLYKERAMTHEVVS